MKIIADENIPYVKQAFKHIADVELVNGRNLQPKAVQDASCLLVRSVTQVNQNLLQSSDIRFVGTATIGFDHIDLDYLAQHNIGFARAPGSNATSAAEYVISALLIASNRLGFTLKNKTVGIIGHGNVGSRVAKRLQALGINYVVNDPPLQEKLADEKSKSVNFIDLNTLLAQADIVSLHVPLEKTGKHPTYHLANKDFFAKIRANALFINIARGDTMDEKALLHKLQTKTKFNAILDVWQNEPNISIDTLQRVILATAHIAGYSFDGKVRGTKMLYQAVCQHFQKPNQWQQHVRLPQPAIKTLSFSDTISTEEAIRKAVFACYDVRDDDAQLRQIDRIKNHQHGEYFDYLRKNYPIRREFSTLTINLPNTKKSLIKILDSLGFKCKKFFK